MNPSALRNVAGWWTPQVDGQPILSLFTGEILTFYSEKVARDYAAFVAERKAQ